MSAIEVVLVYVGIPAAVLTCIVSAVVLPGLLRRPRYRSGEAWPHDPVWYCPHPNAIDPELKELATAPEHLALTGPSRAALPGPADGDGAEGLPEAGSETAEVATARGGAHGEW